MSNKTANSKDGITKLEFAAEKINSAIFNNCVEKLFSTMKSSNSVINPRKDIITFSHGMTNMSDNLLRRTKQGKLFLAKMFFPLLVISLLFTITTTEANAEPTVIPISIPECAQSIPDCGEWHNWGYFAEEMWFDGYVHDPPGPWPTKKFECLMTVAYRSRQCKTNPMMHQHDVLSISVDLSSRIYQFPEGYIYACREALDILKGSKEEVSGFFNALYGAVYEKWLVEGHTKYFAILEEADKTLGGKYAHYRHNPCNETDPNNPWAQEPITVITVNSSCQGTCLFWSDREWRDVETIPIEPDYYTVFADNTYGNSRPMYLGSTKQGLANKYNNGITEGFQVEAINQEELADLNTYIQTEINPYIQDEEYKVPVFMAGPVMTMVKRPCAQDFCCIYKTNICQGDDGKAVLHNQIIEGEVPQECVDEIATPIDVCPESNSRFPSPYPCVSNCNPTSDYPSLNVPTESNMFATISPNPTANYLDVSLKSACKKIAIEVVDLVGNSLFKMDFENKKDFRINFPTVLPDGTYSLILNTDDKQNTINFIIAK